MGFILRGRRSICWGWRLTLLALRIGNDVSYVTRINHEIHFAWQAQYLVRFEVDFDCSAHWKWRFICDADQSWDSFCVAGAVFGEIGGIYPVAPRIVNDVSYVTRINHEMHFAWQGAVFGEVGVWLFVPGAAFGDILGDSRSANMLYFSIQNRFQDRTSKVSEAAGARWRFHGRIIVGLSSDCRRIVFLLAEAIHGVSAEVLNLQISWQAQYLVRLVADMCLLRAL